LGSQIPGYRQPQVTPTQDASAKDLDRLCRLAAVGEVGLAIPRYRYGRWLFALKRGLARWGSMPPRNMGGQLLYPRRIYITDLGQTLSKMCPPRAP